MANRMYSYQELIHYQHYYILTQTKMRSNSYMNIKNTPYSNTSRSLAQGPRQTIVNNFKAVLPDIRNKMQTQVVSAAESMLSYVQNHNCHCARSLQQAQNQASRSKTHFQNTSSMQKTRKPIKLSLQISSPLSTLNHLAGSSSTSKFAKSQKKNKSQTNREKYTTISNQPMLVNQQHIRPKKQRPKSAQKFRQRSTEEDITDQIQGRQVRENVYRNYNSKLKQIVDKGQQLINQLKRLESEGEVLPKSNKVAVPVQTQFKIMKKRRKVLKQNLSKHTNNVHIQSVPECESQEAQDNIHDQQILPSPQNSPAQKKNIKQEEKGSQQLQYTQRQIDQQMNSNYQASGKREQSSQVNQHNQLLSQVPKNQAGLSYYLPIYQSERISQAPKRQQKEIIIECQTIREANKIQESPQSQYSFANKHSSRKRYRLQNLRPQLNQQMQRNDQTILLQSENLRKQLECSRRELQNSKRELEYSKRQLEKSKRELEDSQKKIIDYEYKQTQANTIIQKMIQYTRGQHKYSSDDQLLRILFFQAQQIQVLTAKRQI